VSKKKLQRFAETATFPNFFQPEFEEISDGFYLKGHWNDQYFKRSAPLFLELGCGKGEYTIGLTRKFPDRNYIGIDIKGARMWRGAKTAIEENISHVAFIRTHINVINNLFAANEVDGLWITFPDPQPQQSRVNKRLTSPRFLDLYSHILKPDAVINLKTDDEGLYKYTLEVIEQQGHKLHCKSSDVYKKPIPGEVSEIQTFYEKIWLEQEKKIKFLSFTLKSE
jgi:tRNA (guanine-N7-)-methyltransferase